MSDTDTIAAVATPLGEGGVAVVRISGIHAMTIASACFVPMGPRSKSPVDADSHTVHYGRVRSADRDLDEVLLTVFRAPRSFTREDTVEIACHGGMVVTRLVLEALLVAGARMANPGEFTQRAFLNGRLDLAQAEAVNDLIHARTELAASAALGQLRGSLSRRIEDVRESLMHVLAHIEAHLDFPDEDIAPDTERSLIKRLDAAATALDELLASAWEGRILRNGLRLAIVGRPNAGKSSLLNRLLGYERAIVAPIAGTTRDTIEENAQIRGIPIVLVDTAGMRDSTDFVEQEGIRRSRQAQAEADLVLHVIDGAEGVTEEELAVLTSDKDGKNRLLVWNKIDLGLAIPPLPDEVWLPISCQTGDGLDELKSAIEAKVWTGTKGRGRVDMTVNARQQDALRRARRALDAVRAALREGLGLELAAFDLRVATGAVGEVVGKTSVDDLLDKIFSSFCLGK